MVGYAKNAPMDEEWLGEKIAEDYLFPWVHTTGANWKKMPETVRQGYYKRADRIIALMKEAGWVSPAYLKDALSREMASGFRLGLNKSKGGF